MTASKSFNQIMGRGRGGGARALVSDDTVAYLASHLRAGDRQPGDTLLELMNTYDAVDLSGIVCVSTQRGVVRDHELTEVNVHELAGGVAQHLDNCELNGHVVAKLLNVDSSLYRETLHVARSIDVAPPDMTLR